MSQATLPESRDNRPSCHTAPLAFSRGTAMIPEAALTAPEADPACGSYLRKQSLATAAGERMGGARLRPPDRVSPPRLAGLL
jgi:hypothetical protein